MNNNNRIWITEERYLELVETEKKERWNREDNERHTNDLKETIRILQNENENLKNNMKDLATEKEDYLEIIKKIQDLVRD